LDVARGNAQRHGVLDRIRFLEGDLFRALPDGEERFELVVSNPPYTADAHPAGPEPTLALQAGPEGLDVIRGVVEGAPRHLAVNGTLLVEIADDQEVAVRALAAAVFEEFEIHRDLAGLPRLLEARPSG
jgi:release factor glutamine methyltransferase